MSEPFLAEIRIFGFNFAPRGWAQCNGQLMPISQNTALFSLVGTFYGGDGRVTFALPDFQERAAMHVGQGPGLTPRFQGDEGGSQTVTLLQSEMPAHTHAPGATSESADQPSPDGHIWAKAGDDRESYPYYADAPNIAMNLGALLPTGGGQPHNNMQPYLIVNFCIALQGIFPQRP